MTKEQCAEKLYNQFSTLLNKFMDSDITGNEKGPILEELKCMIDEKIREIHFDEFMEYQSLTLLVEMFKRKGVLNYEQISEITQEEFACMPEDMARAYNVPVRTIYEMIQEGREELIAAGENPDEYFKEVPVNRFMM